MRPLLTAAGCQYFQLRLLQLLLASLCFPSLLPLSAAATTAVVVFLGLLRRVSASACLAAPGHHPRGTATRRRIRRLDLAVAVLHLIVAFMLLDSRSRMGRNDRSRTRRLARQMRFFVLFTVMDENFRWSRKRMNKGTQGRGLVSKKNMNFYFINIVRKVTKILIAVIFHKFC